MGGEGEEVRIERRIGREGDERIDEGEDCSISLAALRQECKGSMFRDVPCWKIMQEGRERLNRDMVSWLRDLIQNGGSESNVREINFACLIWHSFRMSGKLIPPRLIGREEVWKEGWQWEEDQIKLLIIFWRAVIVEGDGGHAET